MRLAARLVIMDIVGNILAVRLKAAPGYWCLPGGTLEQGEDYKTAAVRECIEELGVKPKLANAVFSQQMLKEGQTTLVEFGFAVLNNDDFNEIDLSKTTNGNLEILEAKFIDITKETFYPAKLKVLLPATQKQLLAMQVTVFSSQQQA